MGGWKDEGNAAGDRQLPAAERAIVSQSLSSQADEAEDAPCYRMKGL